MKLYVCWGTYREPFKEHSCRTAHEALLAAGYEPELVKVRGLGVGPKFLQWTTAGRREVKKLSGQKVVPTSYTIPFLISKRSGQFGTTLSAELPSVTPESGYVTGLSMTLRRGFTYRGKDRSYLSAACPAPPVFPGATFPLTRAGFGFAGPVTLTSTLNRSCKVSP